MGMTVSTKGRYALRVMTELAMLPAGTPLPLRDIAQKQALSEKYLEGIVSALVRGGFLEGSRGKGGGYRLTRPLSECSVGEILRLTEGSLAPVSCLDGDTNACPRAGQCSTLPMWEKLDRLINGYLDSVRLSDLLGEDATKL